MKVVTIGTKALYNADGQEASAWVREPVKGLKGVDAPQMSSGLKVREAGSCRISPTPLAYLNSAGNRLQYSDTEVYWLPSACSRDNGFSVLPVNWRRAVALFAARKLVKGNWINDKDEYLVPDEAHPDYAAWVDDCHVYDLLHSSNNCTSMRGVPYKGKLWTISNHWFWLTRAEALALLDSDKTPRTHLDCVNTPCSPLLPSEQAPAWQTVGDPYFAYLLSTGQVTPSPDARALLDKVKALWVDSLSWRELYYELRPVTDKQLDLHLTAWDSGCYQLKNLWRDLFPEEWAELKAAHKALADRLREGVYTYGFLFK